MTDVIQRSSVFFLLLFFLVFSSAGLKFTLSSSIIKHVYIEKGIKLICHLLDSI